MQIVFMNGGLGNQMFQYIFFRWLQEVTGEATVIDDAPFFLENTPHNGYELERIFGLKLPLMSRLYGTDAWQELLAKRKKGVWGLPQVLADKGNPPYVVCEAGVSTLHYEGKIHPYVLGELPRGIRNLIYYHGYWLGDFYFCQRREMFLRELVFPPITEGHNLALEQLIRRSARSAAIHIRRGDMAKLGLANGPEYFLAAIGQAEAKWHPDSYFLFSDDLEWCEANAKILGLAAVKHKLSFVRGNTGPLAYRDMQLMSLCRHRIADRSSFSLMAGVLCRREGKEDIVNWR